MPKLNIRGLETIKPALMSEIGKQRWILVDDGMSAVWRAI